MDYIHHTFICLTITDLIKMTNNITTSCDSPEKSGTCDLSNNACRHWAYHNVQVCDYGFLMSAQQDQVWESTCLQL